jgi:CRP-like cAMP-binding protein
MRDQPDWLRNRLLLALPSPDLKRLLSRLEQIPSEREQVLLDADAALDHVFFPDSGVVSVVAVYDDGSIIEMATIGREGCTGFQAAFGNKSSSVRFLVQIPGRVTKMSRSDFISALKSMPAFRKLVLAYVQAFLEQVLVSGACNGAHSVKERLARWLLMMRDRDDNDALRITQGLLAEMWVSTGQPFRMPPGNWNVKVRLRAAERKSQSLIGSASSRRPANAIG